MYIVRTIPISKGSSIEELSYFSSVPYPRGSLVQAPIRSKKTRALVVSVEAVRAVKTNVKKSSFTLRKLPKQKAHMLVSEEYQTAIEKTAMYHAAHLGSMLHAYIPASLHEVAVPSTDVHGSTKPKPKLRGYIVPRLYQDLASGRIDFYRTTIREAFAAGGSIFIMVPSVADSERLHDALCAGIEKYTYVLHSGLTRSAQRTQISSLLLNTHPVLIIGTPSFLAVPRTDLVSIIVERENSSLYRGRTRPYADARILAYEYASALGGQLYLADLPVRIESVYRKQHGEYEEIVTGAHRMSFKSRAEIVNMQGLATAPKKTFRCVSRELQNSIEALKDSGGQTVLYVARRGLSPITLCRDCGTVVVCKECSASVVLHRGTEENYFLCHSCGSMRHARERCKQCHSWRLEAFGIGTELVERELTQHLPERKVFVLSADTATTHAQAKKIRDAFYETPGSILIGTELILPYLTERVPLVGVVSLDSLLSLASWNIYERIASSLTRLRECARDTFIVQTRRVEASILSQIVGGNFSSYYKTELEARRGLGYPPFTVIIKVSVTGSQRDVEARMQYAKKMLEPYELISFSKMLKAAAGKFTLHGFVRVDRQSWPDEVLVEKLRSLPPVYTVTVDPDSIL